MTDCGSLFNSLSGRLNLLTNQIPVNSVSDFGAAVGGVITFGAADNGKSFVLNKDISTSIRFVIEDGILIQFTSVALKALTYTGTGTMMTSSDFGLLVYLLVGTSAPNGTLWSLSGSGEIAASSAQFFNIGTGGTLSNAFNSFLFCPFTDVGQGFVFNNNSGGTAFSEGGFLAGKNETTTMLTFTGNAMGDITIFDTGISAGSNETMFDFDESLEVGNTRINITSTIILKESVGAVFATDSLDQTYVGSTFVGNSGLANSTSVVKLSLVGNTATTTIATQSTNTIINSNVLYTIDSLIERFLIQDVCTFDNTTNTVNTTFNHGMATNDRLFHNAYSGATLPAELDETTDYHVINANAQDFQLSLTSGGSAVTFDDDGSGTLHYRHSTGVTELAHIIYIGLEDIKCRADGWSTIASTLGAKINVGATIMKIDTAGVITEDQVAAPVGVTNTEPAPSPISNVASISTGEGNIIYVRNETSTTDVVVTDQLIGLNDVS